MATHETSLYDERGSRRKDFGLADLFGASFEGTVERADAELVPAAGVADGIRSCAGLEDAERIINGVSRVRTRTTAAVSEPAADADPVVPGSADGGGLSACAEDRHPGGLRAAKSGKGRVVYFPWDIDRTFWEVLSPDHGKLLRNAVDWAANEPRPVTVTGPGTVGRDGVAAEGVDDGAPGEPDEPDDDEGADPRIHPVAAAEGRGAAAGEGEEGAVAGERPDGPRLQESGGVVTLTIPAIVDHEVVAIEL